MRELQEVFIGARSRLLKPPECQKRLLFDLGVGEAEVMPSEIGRGIKFGIGFALGVGLVMLLFLFGLSTCAGHFHWRMMKQMEEMMPRERRSAPRAQGKGFSFDGLDVSLPLSWAEPPAGTKSLAP